MKVVTSNGTLVQALNFGDSTLPLTAEQAKKIAAQCNVRVELLGIKTRYEVKP